MKKLLIMFPRISYIFEVMKKLIARDEGVIERREKRFLKYMYHNGKNYNMFIPTFVVKICAQVDYFFNTSCFRDSVTVSGLISRRKYLNALNHFKFTLCKL